MKATILGTSEVQVRVRFFFPSRPGATPLELLQLAGTKICLHLVGVSYRLRPKSVKA